MLVRRTEALFVQTKQVQELFNLLRNVITVVATEGPAPHLLFGLGQVMGFVQNRRVVWWVGPWGWVGSGECVKV